MSLRIVQYNDPILRQKGRNVTVFDAELAKLSREMIDTMHEAEGIGLAAQQVGLALQLCVVDLLPMKRSFSWQLDGAKLPLELLMPMVLVNPKVTIHPTGTLLYEEGCLSFPDIRGDVPRHEDVTVTYQDIHGVAHTLICNGIFARCIQHEVDHLNGVLFIDRMEKKVRQALDPAVRELAQRNREKSAP